MAGAKGRAMKRVALSKVKDDLLRYLLVAESEEVIITRHGQAAGAPIGFETEEDVEARMALIVAEGFDCSAEEIGALQEMGDAELDGVAGGSCWSFSWA